MPERLRSPSGVPLTDLALAERFVGRHGPDLRYVRAWRSWLAWDGRRWDRDASGDAERRLKNVLREMIIEAADLADDRERQAVIGHALACSNAPRLRSILELATTEPQVAASPEEFDRDVWAFTVANGTLDLRSGDLRAHQPDDHITRIAPVPYDPTATCPRWTQFLVDVTRGDAELQRYLQRVAGYCLSGDTSEQVWFFMYGPGGNGKTCFVEVLRGVVGDYGRAASFGTFLLRGHETIREDVARLEGARLVTALEPPEGQRLNEALLKGLTGSDIVTARELYRGSREFRPTFKLLLVGNHKPTVWDTSEGFWRRTRLVPFAFTVPSERRIKDYHRVLLAENGPGILRWAVEGCLRWQREGLAEPAAVMLETARYRQDEDLLGDFLDSCVHEAPGTSILHHELRAAYERWAAEADAPVLGTRTFINRLRERGYQDVHSNGKRRWRDVMVRSLQDPAHTVVREEHDAAPPS